MNPTMTIKTLYQVSKTTSIGTVINEINGYLEMTLTDDILFGPGPPAILIELIIVIPLSLCWFSITSYAAPVRFCLPIISSLNG